MPSITVMLSKLKGFSPYHHATCRSLKRAHAYIQGETWSTISQTAHPEKAGSQPEAQHIAKIMQRFHCWIGSLDGMDEVEKYLTIRATFHSKTNIVMQAVKEMPS
jgi:hypothetical protein